MESVLCIHHEYGLLYKGLKDFSFQKNDLEDARIVYSSSKNVTESLNRLTMLS
jgi:hypothetical protein